MYIVSSYSTAILLLIITMMCWGSWANTQKLASKEWPSQLYYWDYTLGLIIMALLFGLTLGSNGTYGRSFIADLQQANLASLSSAFLGGVIFNLSNLLIVAAIDIAGIAIAFPIAVGIALVLGVILNYDPASQGNPALLFLGVGLVTVAIVLSSVIYRMLPMKPGKTSSKGILVSVLSGVIMGFFYKFVAASMATDFAHPEAGKLSSYSAVFIFSIGIFISNFLWNTYFMYKPVKGEAVTYRDYFTKGNLKLHVIGILGGLIWNTGMSLSLISSGVTSPAISYGLSQGATLVATIWGVFVWKEFKEAPSAANKWIAFMFLAYMVGLASIMFAKV